MNLNEDLALQSGESWRKVMHAKANGGINMDLATRHCKELEHFVMWSSFVASAGNEGTPTLTISLTLSSCSCHSLQLQIRQRTFGESAACLLELSLLAA